MIKLNKGSKKIYDKLFENFSIMSDKLTNAIAENLSKELIENIHNEFSIALNNLVDFIKNEAEKHKIQKESFAT